LYGGGKISQRFWEYLIAIEMLDLSTRSVVVDVGGGSPAAGLSIFPRLLAAEGVRVIVVDQDFGEIEENAMVNITLERTLANYDSLCHIFTKHEPTHLTCVSVLEHVSSLDQRGIFDAIEDSFRGERAVFTVEYHEIECHFDQQLTAKSLSEAVAGLHRYYLDRIERSPMHCVNAFGGRTRLWYPLALQFERVGS